MAVGTQQIDQGAIAAASLQPVNATVSPPGFSMVLQAVGSLTGSAAPPTVDPPPLQGASLKSLGSTTQESNIPIQKLDSEANSANASAPIAKGTGVDFGKKFPLNLQLPSIFSLLAAQGVLSQTLPLSQIQSGKLSKTGADISAPIGVKVSAALTLATQTPSIPAIPSIDLRSPLTHQITSKEFLALSNQPSVQPSNTSSSTNTGLSQGAPAPGNEFKAGLPAEASIKISAVALNASGQSALGIPPNTTAGASSAPMNSAAGADAKAATMQSSLGQGVSGASQLQAMTNTAPIQELSLQPGSQVNVQVSTAENGVISSRANLTSQQSATSGPHSNEMGSSVAIAGVNSNKNDASGDLSKGPDGQSNSKGGRDSNQAAFASTFSLAQPSASSSASVQKSSPLSSPLDSQTRLSVAKQVTDRIVLLNAAKQTQSVTVHLQPEGLGQVEAIIKVAGKDMQAILTASHPEVHAALDSMKSDLTQAVTARGLALTGMTVSAKHDGFHSSTDSQKEFKQNTNAGKSGGGHTGNDGRKSSGQQNSPKNFNSPKALVEYPAGSFLGKELAPSPRSFPNRRSVDLTI